MRGEMLIPAAFICGGSFLIWLSWALRRRREIPPLIGLLRFSGVGMLAFGNFRAACKTAYSLPWDLTYLGISLIAFGLLFIIASIATLKRTIYLRPQNLIVWGPYRFSRHPLYLGVSFSLVGFMLGFRAAWGLIHAGLTILFFLFLAHCEEEELLREFGESYRRYREEVPFFLPLPRRRKRAEMIK